MPSDGLKRRKRIMKSTFVLAQVASAGPAEENLKKAEAAILEAVSLYRPDVMVFPENFMSVWPPKTPQETRLAEAQPTDGPFVKGMCRLAAEHGIWLIFGMSEACEDPEDHRTYNTTVIADASGTVVATYRKTHLYDAFSYTESDHIKAGDRMFEPIDTPFGRLGLAVCYEIRFPELTRYQKNCGAEILVVPMAWAAGRMKSDHYHTMLRARAIENTYYVLACDQCGKATIGESVAYDPMGTAVAAAGLTETLLPVYIDTDSITRVSQDLPSYQNRRTDLY